MNVKQKAGWGVIARSRDGRTEIMCGLFITTEARLAFSGVRTHSNNTAEMTAVIEALSCLEVRGPHARDTNSVIYFDSKHAAVVCFGTIQARTHVQLARACQQSMFCVQHRLPLTMQNVCGLTGNLGSEYANHAAALGSFGLISSPNITSRWGRHNFDTSACCGWWL